MSTLEPSEIARYSRHLTLPEVGMEGQLRLREARILVVGAGGLGSPLALYLAAAGVGRIGIVDFDRVDLSNLQRQVLYGTPDVGRSKVEVARERIRAVNPHVVVDAHDVRLGAANALALLSDYDLVADGSDNFATRYLVNDACVLARKPNVYGSIFRFEGQVSVFCMPRGPCYRCLFPEPPSPGAVPSCAEGGVLGVLPGTVGSLQATEALKLVLGRGEPLVGRLLLFDALTMSFRTLELRRDPACPVCGDAPTIRELREVEYACAVEPPAASAGLIQPDELQARLARGDDLVLVDVRSAEEWQICRLEGARHVPLHELPARLGELDPTREVVVYCHLGGRSAMAARFLADRGFARVRDLRGGIDAWAREAEPHMPRY